MLKDSASKGMLRLATIEDLNTLVDFATKFHKNSVYKDREFNRDKVTLFINSLIDNSKGLVLLLEEDNKSIGALIAFAEETLFGLELQSLEVMFWVEEEHRKKDSWELVKAYEYWSKEVMKCSTCVLSRLEDSIGIKLDKVYKSMGYPPVEHSHMKVF